MKKTKRLTMVFDRFFQKTLKVSNIEILEDQYREKNGCYQKAKDELNKQKGALKRIENEILTKKTQLKEVKDICVKLKEEKNLKELKNGYEIYEKEEKNVELLKKQSDSIKYFVEKTEEKLEVYSKNILELENKISILRMKDEFVKNVESFKEIDNILGELDLDTAENEIDDNFYASEFALEDMQKEIDNNVKNFIDKSDALFDDKYQEFVKSL